MKSFARVLFVILLVCRLGVGESGGPAPSVPGATVTPIFLVPGLWYKYSVPVYGQGVFDSFVRWLVAAGFPREHIYVLDYDSTATIPMITRELVGEMNAIIGRYPSSTQFDLFAHSLGGFTGLYAAMESGNANRFRKFVSLAGIPQGWDGYEVCRFGLCGLAHPPLIPYRSPFVLDFLSRRAQEIGRLEKCSLYSPDDGLVRPYDAGRFDDGTNVEIPGLAHMDMVFSRTSFDAVVSHCYGGQIAP